MTTFNFNTLCAGHSHQHGGQDFTDIHTLVPLFNSFWLDSLSAVEPGNCMARGIQIYL